MAAEGTGDSVFELSHAGWAEFVKRNPEPARRCSPGKTMSASVIRSGHSAVRGTKSNRSWTVLRKTGERAKSWPLNSSRGT
jgi:hypothetical protein